MASASAKCSSYRCCQVQYEAVDDDRDADEVVALLDGDDGGGGGAHPFCGPRRSG